MSVTLSLGLCTESASHLQVCLFFGVDPTPLDSLLFEAILPRITDPHPWGQSSQLPAQAPMPSAPSRVQKRIDWTLRRVRDLQIRACDPQSGTTHQTLPPLHYKKDFFPKLSLWDRRPSQRPAFGN